MNHDLSENGKRNERFTTVYGIALRLDAERTRQMREIEERRLAEKARVKWWQRIFRKQEPVLVAPETPVQRGVREKLERASQVRVYRSDINGNPIK